jgi:hypothetical protein
MKIKNSSLTVERIRRQIARRLPGSAKSHDVEQIVQNVLQERGLRFRLTLPSHFPPGIPDLTHIPLQRRKTTLMQYFSMRRLRKVVSATYESDVVDYSGSIALAMKKFELSNS